MPATPLSTSGVSAKRGNLQITCTDTINPTRHVVLVNQTRLYSDAECRAQQSQRQHRRQQQEEEEQQFQWPHPQEQLQHFICNNNDDDRCSHDEPILSLRADAGNQYPSDASEDLAAGCRFTFAAINNSKDVFSNVKPLTMLFSSGTSGHCIDSLLYCTTTVPSLFRTFEVLRDAIAIMNACLHTLHGTTTGVLKVLAADAGGAKRMFDLPATTVPRPGLYLFSSATAQRKVYPPFISNAPHLDSTYKRLWHPASTQHQ